MKKIYLVVIGILIYIYIIFNPIVIYSDTEHEAEVLPFIQTENNIKLMKGININSDIKMFLIINDRENISKEIPLGKILQSNDKSLLKKLCNMNFLYTNSDIATVQNELLVYSDSQLVFRTGIVIEEDTEGLQNFQYGWIKSKKGNLNQIMQKFRRPLIPIIILPQNQK